MGTVLVSHSGVEIKGERRGQMWPRLPLFKEIKVRPRFDYPDPEGYLLLIIWGHGDAS